MTGMYHFTLIRSGGWVRLGATAAVGVVFVTPMLWALGRFGVDPEAPRRAVIFAAAGVGLALALGSGVAWAVRGFLVRKKEGGEDGERRPAAATGHPGAVHPHPHGAPAGQSHPSPGR